MLHAVCSVRTPKNQCEMEGDRERFIQLWIERREADKRRDGKRVGVRVKEGEEVRSGEETG